MTNKVPSLGELRESLASLTAACQDTASDKVRITIIITMFMFWRSHKHPCACSGWCGSPTAGGCLT